ncbi:MAG: RNA methyltransferase [Thermodesulfobacteriota bacterium]
MRQGEERVKELMANAAVVLVRPKFAENIGSAARVAMNMGVGQLLVVADASPDQERMLRLATHNARHLVEPLCLFGSLDEALAPFAWVVGTSARHGRKRATVKGHHQLLAEAVPRLAANRVALLFGPEDSGLTSEDLRRCHQVVTIPTVDFSSLNLAQAVAILCHELHSAVIDTVLEGVPVEGPRHADQAELAAMYGHLREALSAIGFLKGGNDDYWMQGIRQFFGRVGMRAREIRIVRGICRQILWRQGRRGQ